MVEAVSLSEEHDFQSVTGNIENTEAEDEIVLSSHLRCWSLMLNVVATTNANSAGRKVTESYFAVGFLSALLREIVPASLRI